MAWLYRTAVLITLAAFANADEPRPTETVLPEEANSLQEQLNRSDLSSLERQQSLFYYRVPVEFKHLCAKVALGNDRQADNGEFAKGWVFAGEYLCICEDKYASIYDARDFGTVSRANGLMTLTSNRPIAEHAMPIKRQFHVIQWGSRTYLVEPSRMIEFCNAINERAEPRENIASGDFLARFVSVDPPPVGVPEIPDSFRKYLLKEKVDSRVIAVDAETVSRFLPELEQSVKGQVCRIAVAKDTPLLAGMLLYSIDARARAKGYVTSVKNEVAEVIVFSNGENLKVGNTLSNGYKAPVIIPGWRFSNYEENEPLMKGNPISPAEAEKRVELFIKENPDPKLPKQAGSFEGMLNDEYLFSMKGEAHKHGFVLYGYRVNAKNGSVRFVDRHIASVELGGKFPMGYIPFGVGELKKCLMKKPPKTP